MSVRLAMESYILALGLHGLASVYGALAGEERQLSYSVSLALYITQFRCHTGVHAARPAAVAASVHLH